MPGTNLPKLTAANAVPTVILRHPDWPGVASRPFGNHINVGDIIRQYNLQAAMEKFIHGINGGIWAPHLHFNNQIYPLTPEQWSKISVGIVEEARAKLANVNHVSFEQAQALGAVLQTLG